MITDLQTRLETLYGQERRRNKLGLEGTRDLLHALGDPHLSFRSVHVAGTNGKGTVCALIERVLRESGHRTGLYTSPHLVDFRERIRVAGQWADEAGLDAKLSLIESLPEGRDRTFFEVATALGFLDFAERGVEIAVVEVGLGGRLDCTNVITPEVCVITSIGLDHTEILGDTLAEIAREKAGIIKPGVPVVLPWIQPAALHVLEAVALERGAPIAPPFDDRPPLDPSLVAKLGMNPATRAKGLGERRPSPWGERLKLPAARIAPAQASNQSLALGALAVLVEHGFSIPAEAVASGLAMARWPGRFERCPTQPRLWWDAAHNPQGFRELGRAWTNAHREPRPSVVGETSRIPPAPPRPPGAVVLALSRDKDVESVLTELRWAFEPLRLIVTRSRNGRAMEPADLLREAQAQQIEARIVPDVAGAVREALAISGESEVLLCGSIFAIGEAMEGFGGAPGEWL